MIPDTPSGLSTAWRSEHRPVWPWLVAAGLCVAAGSLRVLAATGELWFDEVWSIQNALEAATALEVFHGIHVDNNHWLNSLFIRMVGDSEHSIPFRLLAVGSGIGSVILVTGAGLRQGPIPALTVGTLFSFSYLMVQMDSEARGYGPAMFFGVCAYLALACFLRRPGPGPTTLFALSATLGILSQLTFAWVYAGLILWSAAALRRDRARSGDEAVPLLKALVTLHTLPSVTLGALWLIDIRNWQIAGAPPTPVGEGLSDFVSYAFGVPQQQGVVVVIGALIGSVILLEILRLAREGDPVWLFFLVAVVVGPLTFLATMDLGFFFPRYVVVSLPFALILMASFLERMRSHAGSGTALWGTALLLFLVGNGVHLYRFLPDGRGQYRAALTEVLQADHGSEVHVGLSAGRAQRIVAEFHAARVPEGHRLRMRDMEGTSADEVDWIVVQPLRRQVRPPPVLVDHAGGSFELAGRFQHWGPSGWTWDLYRRIDG